MSYPFSADEIFEVAINLEINGAKFYREAAAKVTNADHKKLLTHLAEMEDEHEQTFKKMKADLSGKEKSKTVFDPEAERRTLGDPLREDESRARARGVQGGPADRSPVGGSPAESSRDVAFELSRHSLRRAS